MTSLRVLLGCLLAGLILQAHTSSAGDCPPYWTHFQGYCYRLFGDPVTYQAASLACQQLASELTSVHSAGENTFLYTYWKNASRSPQPSHRGYWLGLNDIDEEGTFVNADGTPLDYQKWWPREPSNRGGNENCGHVWYKGMATDAIMAWNDMPCSTTMSYICKQRAPCQ